jgi:hypothetical protein
MVPTPARPAAPDAKFRDRGDAEDIVDHPHDAEGAGLDHRDRVQQRADRRRARPWPWQPAVQRHDRRLDRQPAMNSAKIARRLVSSSARSALGELDRPGGAFQPDDRPAAPRCRAACRIR